MKGEMMNVASLVRVLGLASVMAGATARYQIDFAPASKPVQAGQPGRLRLQIAPSAGYKVSDKAPLRVRLKATGVRLEQDTLSRKDRVASEALNPTFIVPFQADGAGDCEVQADIEFFICTEKLCERVKERRIASFVVAPQ